MSRTLSRLAPPGWSTSAVPDLLLSSTSAFSLEWVPCPTDVLRATGFLPRRPGAGGLLAAAAGAPTSGSRDLESLTRLDLFRVLGEILAGHEDPHSAVPSS